MSEDNYIRELRGYSYEESFSEIFLDTRKRPVEVFYWLSAALIKGAMTENNHWTYLLHTHVVPQLVEYGYDRIKPSQPAFAFGLWDKVRDGRLVSFGDAKDYEPRQYELAYWWDRLDKRAISNWKRAKGCPNCGSTNVECHTIRNGKCCCHNCNAKFTKPA